MVVWVDLRRIDFLHKLFVLVHSILHGGNRMAKQIRTILDEVLPHFDELEDPRSEINRKHPLPSVIVIAIMAVLSGANGPTAIARWAILKQEFLCQWLPLPHGTPGKDVFRRVLATLNPTAFQLCFANWLRSLQDQSEDDTTGGRVVLNVDGKTLRRSHDRQHNLGPLHLVSVWCSDEGLTLAQVATDEKSNEITAIPEVLRLVDLKKAIITIDAMGTQTAIAKQIVESGADYVLALKRNHPGLSGSITAYAEHHAKRDFNDIKIRRNATEQTGHGRKEQREVIQFLVPDDLPDRERWAGLKTIAMVTLRCQRGEKQTTETRYYLSSLPLGVKQIARAVRSHWSIENTCHWSLDMTYREDESRIRNRHVAENFAWLNRFTLSLLKQHPRRDSLSGKRQACGWNDTFLLEVLTSKAT